MILPTSLLLAASCSLIDVNREVGGMWLRIIVRAAKPVNMATMFSSEVFGSVGGIRSGMPLSQI